jgi:peptidoglycan/xylan/chitin deacetylase (PgdA/CDA1 family)
MRTKLRKSAFVAGSVFTGFALIASVLSPAFAQAATPTTLNSVAKAKISFTFDDALQSAYTQAEPTLAKYGLTGTDYVPTGCVGMTTVPNTCAANTDSPYMTWAQIQALQNTNGWEIGSHTVDHYCLVSSGKTDPGDCANPKPLTTAQVTTELASSKSTLAAKGINATDFAPPYGDFNNPVLAQIAKYYASMRQFANASNNTNIWPYSDYYLQNYVVLQTTNPPATVEAAINNAIANNQWLVLTFHDIMPSPSATPDDYQYGTAELDQIAAYVQAKQAAGQIQSVNINQGLVTSTTNMLSDPSFNDGIADGWTTDNAAAITADKGNNGSYPDPTNSIKLTSTSTGANAHLFSPKVAVSPNTTYMFKNFLNVQAVNSGVVAFYVDEYDVNGNWISGQYVKQETSAFVEDMNFTYKPSSVNVAKASLQVIVGGTGVTAYLDNSQMFPLTTPVAQTNLMPNEAFDSGISGGWSTNAPATIVADSGNHGGPNNPINSVKFTASTANTHLFSPQIAVSSAHTYSLSNYLNLQTIGSGEVAFYVDEYNSSGQWISGQYKVGVHTVGAGDVNFTYQPSSVNVAKASLQFIVVGNSGATGYLDDIRWYQN